MCHVYVKANSVIRLYNNSRLIILVNVKSGSRSKSYLILYQLLFLIPEFLFNALALLVMCSIILTVQAFIAVLMPSSTVHLSSFTSCCLSLSLLKPCGGSSKVRLKSSTSWTSVVGKPLVLIRYEVMPGPHYWNFCYCGGYCSTKSDSYQSGAT